VSRLLAIACLAIVFLAYAPRVHAGDFIEDNQSTGGSGSENVNTDSTFDPFSDYSEFEEGSDQEADLNFFHNGRFFSIGFIGGYETFTDVLGSLYKPGLTYGAFLEYFFNMRFAMQLSYSVSDHAFYLAASGGPCPGGTACTGDVSLQRFEMDFKYFLSTQNVIRGLAAINPYIIAGFGSYTRNITFSNVAGSQGTSAFGLQAGFGVEFPIVKGAAFWGLQATYDYISFPDANSAITINGTSTGIFPTGGALDIQGSIGINF